MNRINVRVCIPNIDCLDTCHFDQFDNKDEKYFDQIRLLVTTPRHEMMSLFNATIIPIDLKPTSYKNELDSNGFNYPIDTIQLAVQRNQCDFGYNFYKSPVWVENVTQGPILDDDILEMLSAYNIKNLNQTEGDALDSFYSFSRSVLGLVFFFFLLIGFAIYLSRQLRVYYVRLHKKWFKINHKKRIKKGISIQDLLFLMFNNFIKVYDPFPPLKTLSMILLWFCFTSFGFYVSYYYSSMITTEAVTVRAPRVAMTYQDVLDMNLTIYCEGAFGSHVSFKSASNESLKGKIWRKNKFEIIEPKVDNMFRFEEIFSPRILTISSRRLLKYFKFTGYSRLKAKNDKNLKAMLISDPSETPHLSAVIVNSHVNPFYQKLVNKYCSRRLQADLNNNAYLQISRIFMFLNNFVTQNPSKDFSDIQDYVSSRIILPSPEILTPNLRYFKGLFILSGICFLICFIVLIFEKFYFVSQLFILEIIDQVSLLMPTRT